MTQIQPAELPVHRPQDDQPPALRIYRAHWRFIATFFMFAMIVLIGHVRLPVAVFSSTAAVGLIIAVPALIAGSLFVSRISRQRAFDFISGGRKLAAARPVVQAESFFYRNARCSVPDVIRLPDASSALRTTA